MAELTTATTASSCCAPEAQAVCCEPSAKAECCDPSHGEVCRCSVGDGVAGALTSAIVRPRKPGRHTA